MFRDEIQKVCYEAAQVLLERNVCSDKAEKLACFFDHCGWGIVFGGTLGDEVYIVLEDIMEE